jgi:PAS domain S-box-containing protein
MSVSDEFPVATTLSEEQPTPSGFIVNLTERLSNIGQAVLGFGQGETRFREVIEALPVAIYTTDAAGRLTFYNSAAAEMWGRRPELGDDWWCGSWKLYRLDGTPLPHDECPMAVALKTRQPVRGVEAIAERPDGTRVPFAPHPTPIFDNSGNMVGAVNMLLDLTDRRTSEESAQRLAAIVEFSDDAIVTKDLRGIITSWNRGAERLFGYSTEEVIGKSITILIPTAQVSEEASILERLKRGEHIEHYETIRRRKDGSAIDISLTISPVYNSLGQVVGASKIARDITERRRAQQQQKLLLAEIMHRVKNTLATVQAIAMQTMRGAPSDELSAFTARLHTLGRAHDLLTSDKWDRTSLRSVVNSALEPFQQQRFTVEGPEVWLNASKSLQLTLALHELATNAVKYGALSNQTGRIRIAWEVDPEGRVSLSWRESGGPPVTPPKDKGFGSILIERTFEDAYFEYAPGGLACRMQVIP